MTKTLSRFLLAAAVAFGGVGDALESVLAPRGSASVPGLTYAQEPPPPRESIYLQPDTRPAKPLSLREMVEAAIANNLDVAIRRKDTESARYGVIQAKAFFDPLLQASGSYGRSKSEPLSDFGSQGSKFWSGDASLTHVLPHGADYTARWFTNKSTTIYPAGAFALPFFNPLSPTYGSGLSLTFNQRLLRGLGTGVNRTEIEIAQIGITTSEETFRSTVIETLRQAENAYWDLSAAISNLEVTRQSLKLANDLLEQNRKKVEVGTLAPIQITEAEASVASREEGVILAEADIRNSEDNLRRILNVPPAAPDWTMAISPSDKAPFEPGAIDLDDMIRQALEKRPEIIQERHNVRTAELRHRRDHNARLPLLDAFANYQPAGNNYRAVRVVNPATGETETQVELIDGGLSESTKEAFRFDIYDWSVGLNFAIPIGNRNAKATEARSRIALEQAQMTLESLERSVQVDVRTAVRAVETGAKRVAAARSNIFLQEKKLEAEQKRFDNGMSTSFQVLTFQNDLTAARSSEIAAITAYNKALVELGRVTGTLPERRGVTIVAP